MRRPLRKRIWFYKPDFDYFKPIPGFEKPKFFSVLSFGGADEFNWHTVVVGHPYLGRMVVALRECPRTGRCAEDARDYPEIYAHKWPYDIYGHNTLVDICDTAGCACQERD